MKVDNQYSADLSDLDQPLMGWPSLAYGMVRSLAFRERKKITQPNMRVLFGEAGRRSVPWGGLWCELNGNIYQFGSGIASYPEALGPNGKGLSKRGLEMLAEGVPVSLVDRSLDFKWVQDELDLTFFLTPEMISSIEEEVLGILNGTIQGRMYQSRMRARAMGLPIRDDSDNCTSFIAGLLGSRLGLDFPEYMPIEFFIKLRGIVQKKIGNSCSDLDSQFQTLLNLGEPALEASFKNMFKNTQSLKGLTKYPKEIPESFTWEALLVSAELKL